MSRLCILNKPTIDQLCSFHSTISAWTADINELTLNNRHLMDTGETKVSLQNVLLRHLTYNIYTTIE